MRRLFLFAYSFAKWNLLGFAKWDLLVLKRVNHVTPKRVAVMLPMLFAFVWIRQIAKYSVIKMHCE